MAKFVVDVSLLIELRQRRQLGMLTRPIARGQIVVPYYVLKKLRKPWWRDWLDRNESRVVAHLVTEEEHITYAELLTKFAAPESNPKLSDDDLMAIAIARCRDLPLAIRDNNAERVARGLGVRVVHLDEFLIELRGPPAGQTHLFDRDV